jgi:hypothetical protein
VRIEEIAVPRDAQLLGTDEVIARCFEAAGLRVVMKGTVAAYPGSVHWHLKRAKERGTLEVTLWPARRRVWLSVHANRSGGWIDETVSALKQSLPGALTDWNNAAARGGRRTTVSGAWTADEKGTDG